MTVFDGAIGTEVQKRAPDHSGKVTDLLNITEPETIKKIHLDYLDAGAQFLTTNTFSSNRIRLSQSGYEDESPALNEKGAEIARAAAEEFSCEERQIMVAGSIGPTGEALTPLGGKAFDQFYRAFADQGEALKRGGADWLIVETMESLREAKAALLAAKQTGLPTISSLSYGEKGRTSYGVEPSAGAVTLDRLGGDVLAMNCGTGPGPYPERIRTYRQFTDKPLLAEANAGNPTLRNGETVYEMSPEEYLEKIRPGLPYLSGVGSCCGSDPGFTEVLAEIAPEYGEKEDEPAKSGAEFICNNSTVTRLSDDVEFREIEVNEKEINQLKEKLGGRGINMLKFTGISRTTGELEELLARQFLRLRTGDPLGIVTGNREILRTFLIAYPGVAPIRATNKDDSIRVVAEKYGGILI